MTDLASAELPLLTEDTWTQLLLSTQAFPAVAFLPQCPQTKF